MPTLRIVMTRLRGLTGLATAVIPAAILVHLVAEALSLGRTALGIDFIARHVYLALLLAGGALAFSRTVGLGRGRSEVRRRTALLRAALAGPHLGTNLPILAACFLGFFALTQAGEGFPVLSGAIWLGLGAGLLGSVLAAVLVWAFGRSLVVVALDLLVHEPRRRVAAVSSARPLASPVSRSAADAFTLFVPNRPPPARPSSDSSLHQKGTSCVHFFAQRRSRPRFSSLSFSS
jgi:hypothetical protein